MPSFESLTDGAREVARLDENVRSARILCAVAAVLYMSWYFVVRAVLPGAFNPVAGPAWSWPAASRRCWR